MTQSRQIPGGWKYGWDQGANASKGIFQDQALDLILVARDELDRNRATEGLTVHEKPGVTRGLVGQQVRQRCLCIDQQAFLRWPTGGETVAAVREDEDVAAHLLGKDARDGESMALYGCCVSAQPCGEEWGG